jgi:hypothetical protein
MRLLTDLPAETILGIYSLCSSVHDVLNLSQTCRRLHALLPPSQKLSVLLSVAEVHAGPIFDVVQLLTVNDMQAAHEIRQPSISYSLLRDIISVSHTAREWQEIYPSKKWDEKYADRRVLTAAEQYSLRRAIYRLGLFSRAFHNCNYPRESRLHPIMIAQRCRLLRAWSTEELAEIEDVRAIMRSVLESSLLGNDDLHWELEPAFPGRHQQQPSAFPLASRSYLNLASTMKNAFHTSYERGLVNQRPHGRQTSSLSTGMYGWVDDITRFYVLEDLMKLDPEQVLWLRENACPNMQVLDHVAPVGEEWFMNNGETFAQTFEAVMVDRGEDVREIRERIARGELGIARRIGDLQDVKAIDS